MKTNARIAPTRLGHLNLFVSDVERSAAFYRDVCGFKEVFREPAISMIFMSNGNTHHDLGLMEITPGDRLGKGGFKHSASKTPGLNHLGFELDTEIQLVEAYRRLQDGGVPISRLTDHQISKSVYVQELNGLNYEFYADSLEDWKRFYAEHVGELISGPWDPEAKAPAARSLTDKSPILHREESAALEARNVAYAGVPVKNLEASLDYYADVLGMDAVFVDEKSRSAILQGAGHTGCDVYLVETREAPAVRLMFGGITMHNGKPLEESLKTLREQGIPAVRVGDDATSAVVVMDPDRIPLVYSTCDALQLLKEHGPEIVLAVRQLSAMEA